MTERYFLIQPWRGVLTGGLLAALPIAMMLAVMFSMVMGADSQTSELPEFDLIKWLSAWRFWVVVAIFALIVAVGAIPSVLIVGWPVWNWVVSKGLNSGVAALWVGALTVALPVFLICMISGQPVAAALIAVLCGISGAVGGGVAWVMAYRTTGQTDV